MRRLFTIPILLSGCWLEYEAPGLVGVPFTNDFVESDSAVVLTFEPDPPLACPDGKAARFYVVYDPSKTATAEAEEPGEAGDSGSPEGPTDDTGGHSGLESSPVALVFHSSSFDYVIKPDIDDPLSGTHYRAGTDEYTRLHQGWGVAKVWETLGMHEAIEPSEVNLGTLPAALVNAGVVTLYPTNCWGDLWHNDLEGQPNDLATELGLQRYGFTYAQWMIRFLNDADFATGHKIDIGLDLDLDRLILVGLGDGARAIVEILQQDDSPAVHGVLLDSPIDDFSTWAGDQRFQAEAEGLARLYNYGGETNNPEPNWTQESLRQLVWSGKFDSVNTALVYSDADPRVPFPQSHYSELRPPIENLQNSWAVDTRLVGHVFTNRDGSLARDAVGFLLTGEQPAAPVDTGADTGNQR